MCKGRSLALAYLCGSLGLFPGYGRELASHQPMRNCLMSLSVHPGAQPDVSFGAGNYSCHRVICWQVACAGMLKLGVERDCFSSEKDSHG